MPTIAGLSSINYTNRTLGRDVLNVKDDFAFIVNKKISPSSYGILNKSNYLRIFRNGSGMEFHDLQSDDPAKDIKDDLSDETERLRKMTVGIYETAKYMLYHNN